MFSSPRSAVLFSGSNDKTSRYFSRALLPAGVVRRSSSTSVCRGGQKSLDLGQAFFLRCARRLLLGESLLGFLFRLELCETGSFFSLAACVLLGFAPRFFELFLQREPLLFSQAPGLGLRLLGFTCRLLGLDPFFL